MKTLPLVKYLKHNAKQIDYNLESELTALAAYYLNVDVVRLLNFLGTEHQQSHLNNKITKLKNHGITYEQWVLLIKYTHDPKYYFHLHLFAHIIVSKLDKGYKQHAIAKQLRLNGPQLSNLVPLLREIK